MGFLDAEMGFSVLGEFSQWEANLSLVGDELLICSSCMKLPKGFFSP